MTQKTGKFAAAGDALISVTVYKTNPNQKAGIKVLQKLNGGIYITAIAKGGLLDGTRVDVGDKLLSINGRRMRPGQDTRDFMKLISAANEKVTIVVKKDGADKNKKKTPFKPPGKPKKIFEADKTRAKDGSFDFNINPKLDEFQRSMSKFDDDKDQIKIVTRKLFPDQSAGLAFKKKDEKLFVNGITLDSIFKDTDLEFGDRIVAVMDVNMMNFADADYAKTLLKRAKDDVELVVEKGWNLLDKKTDLDRRHGLASEDSVRKERMVAKVTIVKNKPMESLTESKSAEDDGWRRKKADEDGPLHFTPDSTGSRKTLELESESENQENLNAPALETPESKSQENSKTPAVEAPSPVAPETTANNKSTPDKKSHLPQHPIARTLTPSASTVPAPARPARGKSGPARRSKAFIDMETFERTPENAEAPVSDESKPEDSATEEKNVDKDTASPPRNSYSPDKESNASTANDKPRTFLKPMPKQSKKNYSRGEVDAGDVVTRMLDKLDNERKAIKERHRLRLDRSFDDSADGSSNVPSSSEEGSPRKRPSQTTTPTRHSSNRTYPGVKNYSSPSTNGNHYHSPTSTGLTRNLRKHQHGYLCISVRKKSERSPGVKLRRKDDIFILDKLPHDETRIPVGVQVLAINGNDSFSTVVKANELIDSKKQEVELCVSFEGLIAAWASGANGGQ